MSGLIILVLNNFFRGSFNDFVHGFFDGLSFILIIGSFIYMCWCFAHKRNPFTILIKGDEDEKELNIALLTFASYLVLMRFTEISDLILGIILGISLGFFIPSFLSETRLMKLKNAKKMLFSK
jgi:xanthine/uracil permease